MKQHTIFMNDKDDNFPKGIGNNKYLSSLKDLVGKMAKIANFGLIMILSKVIVHFMITYSIKDI